MPEVRLGDICGASVIEVSEISSGDAAYCGRHKKETDWICKCLRIRLKSFLGRPRSRLSVKVITNAPIAHTVKSDSESMNNNVRLVSRNESTSGKLKGSTIETGTEPVRYSTRPVLRSGGLGPCHPIQRVVSPPYVERAKNIL